MAYQLLVGFDQAIPEEEAAAAAVVEWRESLERDGWHATSEPVARVVRTEARTALGEYAIEVTGQRSHDGEDGRTVEVRIGSEGGDPVDGDV